MDYNRIVPVLNDRRKTPESCICIRVWIRLTTLLIARGELYNQGVSMCLRLMN